jgi:hypothetical protein
MVVEGQGLGPGDEVGGQGDHLEPDPVGLVVVERQVAQAGVVEAADAVFAAGALTVTNLQGGQGPAGAAGVSGDTSDAPAVVVGQPQLGTGMRTLSAGDDPHPGRPFLRAVGGR